MYGTGRRSAAFPPPVPGVACNAHLGTIISAPPISPSLALLAQKQFNAESTLAPALTCCVCLLSSLGCVTNSPNAGCTRQMISLPLANVTCFKEICDNQCQRCDEYSQKCMPRPCFDVTVPSHCDCPRLSSETLVAVGAVSATPQAHRFPLILPQHARNQHAQDCFALLLPLAIPN